MKNVGKVASFILLILIVIVIGSSIYGIVLNNTVLNREYIMQSVEESNYYSELKNELKDDFDGYILQSGLESKVLNNIYSDEILKQSVKDVINNIYDGKELVVNTDVIKNNLDKNISSYLNEKNINVTKDEKASIEKFENTIVDTYKQEVGFNKYSGYINKVSKYLPKIKKLVETGINFTYVTEFILIICLTIVNRKDMTKLLNYVAIGFMSLTGVFILPKIYVTAKLNLDTLQILNKSISEVISNIVNNIVNVWMHMGILTLLVGIFFAIVNALSYEKKNKK